MATKKLYKVKTKTVLYELYEVEAESYDKALDSVFEGQDDHHDDYPINVDRIGWWYDDKEFIEHDSDEPGLIGISVTSDDYYKLPSYDQFSPQLACGWWRVPTEEENVADEAQAVKDGRIAQTIF